MTTAMPVRTGQLHPRLKELLAEFPADWKVVSGCRTWDEAAEICSWGRTKQNPYSPATLGQPFGPVATNAMDGSQTPHTVRNDGYGYAMDVRPGKATPADYELLRQFVERRGFVSGASFKVGGQPDFPHVELPGWRAVPCTAPARTPVTPPLVAEGEEGNEGPGAAVTAVVAVVGLVAILMFVK